MDLWQTSNTDFEFCQSGDRALILGMLMLTIKDFLYSASFHYLKKTAGIEKDHPRAFLFDDDYLLDWGDMIISPRDLLDLVDIDIDYIREKVRIQEKKKLPKAYKQSPKGILGQ